MKPYKHQIDLASKGINILREHMLVYLAMEERTGKTLTSILIAEQVKVKKILVLTKKKALEGWDDTLERYEHDKDYTVTNYHQASKLEPIYDLVILDEAHNYLSAFPKPSKMWLTVKALTKGRPIIYLSATPFAQGHQLLYNQLRLSSWSPWKKYLDGKQWFNKYGIPQSIYVNGRIVQIYTKTDPICFNDVKHLFITKTRKELDFEHEPEDQVHYIELNEKTRNVYNYVLKYRAIELNGMDLVCDSIMKLRTALHSIEGGTVIISTPDPKKTETKTVKGKRVKVAKMKRNYIVLGNDEKVQYILDTFGDSMNTVIMYNYKAEYMKLAKYFSMATLLQATSYAEGIDLSGYDNLVIYSQDWSTARHTQRRARQTNKERDSKIVVHFILVKDAISDEVYNTVSVNKMNYVDKLFRGKQL